MSSQSNASEPNYDELYSNRYTAITGFDLSEDGVKKALEHFDQLHPLHRLASIAVVGEQNYQSLTGYIKDIYNRRPEHAPDASVAFFIVIEALWINSRYTLHGRLSAAAIPRASSLRLSRLSGVQACLLVLANTLSGP